MNSLILRLEEIKMETKGISYLIGALFYAGESGTSLDDFSDGLNLLFGISVHLLNKNNKASNGGDAA